MQRNITIVWGAGPWFGDGARGMVAMGAMRRSQWMVRRHKGEGGGEGGAGAG